MTDRSRRVWRISYLGKIGLICLLLFGIFNTAHAFDVGNEEINITLDATYVTKYLWQGYDILWDDQAAFQPSIELSWRGFTASFWASWATNSGYTDLDEYDYSIGYDRSFYEEDWYATDAWLYYTYFDYPNSDSEPGADWVADTHEISFGLSLPNLLEIGPAYLVPSYSAYYEMAGKDTSNDEIDSGWIHEFQLAYDLPIPALIQEQEEQALSFIWGITFNDGIFGSDSDWSHTIAGISTTFEWNNFYFTPAANYQWSFEDTVNDEDEFLASFSIGYSF